MDLKYFSIVGKWSMYSFLLELESDRRTGLVFISVYENKYGKKLRERKTWRERDGEMRVVDVGSWIVCACTRTDVRRTGSKSWKDGGAEYSGYFLEGGIPLAIKTHFVLSSLSTLYLLLSHVLHSIFLLPTPTCICTSYIYIHPISYIYSHIHACICLWRERDRNGAYVFLFASWNDNSGQFGFSLLDLRPPGVVMTT